MMMQDLDTLLTRRTPTIAALMREVVDGFVAQYPEMTAAVKLGWGAVNFHHPRAGFVIAVFPADDHVAVIFQHGRLLSSPLLVDNGKVKQVRWIPIRPGEDIPWDEIGILLAEAIALRA
jgi:hypothetical protein